MSRSAVTLKVEPVSLGAVYVVPFAEEELSAQAVGKGTVQSPLDLRGGSDSLMGFGRNFLMESAHRRAFRMTLANYGIRMLWRLQHYRTHERSRHKAPAWELCGVTSVHEALWTVLLEDPTCPEGGVWSRRLLGTL